MQFELEAQIKKDLEIRHRVERDGRVRDRIKAVLLKSEDWANEAIGQALRIHPETVAQHLRDWSQEQKLKPENGGSQGNLTGKQVLALEKHLQEVTYSKVLEICAYVAQTCNVQFTVSGMTKWLQEHNFRYKQPKAIPAKANAQKQEEFIESYLNIVANTPSEDPIVFIDAVHPTMATKISYGWIKKGIDKLIETIASRTRVNVVGAIELKTMNVVSNFVETVNSQTILGFFDQLQQAYPRAKTIHVILDQSGYHRSQAVKEGAGLRNIELHFLPTYSPNLNPIERLWKVMNEQVRNNVVFESAKAFRQALSDFFTTTIPKIKNTLASRINDNFQTLPTASSG